jgi:ribosomal-protein-serine acetyltransferase
LLRLLDDTDAEALYAQVDRERERLSPWLPWAADETLAGVRSFITASREQEAQNNGFQVALVRDDEIIGVLGFHAISWLHRSTTIGYWLAAGHEGRGIMTTTVRALVDHAFSAWELHRVEIRAAVENHRSRAIPERLGFVQEGVLRDAERVAGRYLDEVVYSMLAPDWASAR